MQIAKKLLSVFLAALLLGTAAGGAGLATAASVPFSGSGTQDSPYLIASDADWLSLAQYVADGGETAGKFFRQTENVTASACVGSLSFPFRGRYDGDGKTLTAALNANTNCVAPFSYIRGATIENLRVAGAVSGGMHCSGLVGSVSDTDNLIRNCAVEASITTSGTHCGGFVGHGGNSEAELDGCVFSGSIYGGAHVGVLWGWSDENARVTLRNCLENGTEYTAQNLNPVALGAAKSRTTGIIGYITPQIGNPSRNWLGYGRRVYTIEAGENVSLDFGNAKTLFNVSDLGVHSADLLVCGGVGFAQANKTVTLTPSCTDGRPAYAVRFSPSAGTFADGVLTMPAQNVTISAVLSVNDTVKAIQLAVSGKAPNVKGTQQNSVWFGSYKQSGSKTDGYSIDPIKWRVLSNADDKLFLLSDQNLDVFAYNKQERFTVWETSDMRKWLNGLDAYSADSFQGNAFTATEYAVLAQTELINGENPDYYATPSEDNTTDKVFLLSIPEAMNTAYGFAGNMQSSNTRVSTNTAYTAGGGKTGGIMYSADSEDIWWLRSPGGIIFRAAYVSSFGLIETRGNPTTSTGVAVRPAVQVDLGKVLFTSAAENGKQTGGLTAVGSYSGKEWKLTVLDDSRADFKAACAADDNGVRTIQYSGAKTGANERISAMIVNSDGVVTYYGVLCDAETGKNTVTVDVNGKLHDGDTLYVFNEQQNGDKKTDYASALHDVTETAERVETPTAVFTAESYDTGTLSGLTAGMTYSISGGAEVTAQSTSVRLTGLAPCTVSVVNPGNGTTSVDSAAQTIDITRASAPTLNPTQPATIRDKGAIPTTAAHQTSTDGVNWTNAGGAWTDLAEGTYYVRVKAADTALASDPQTITIAVPRYTVRFVNEDGTELQSGAVACGETPAYTGVTPTKSPSATHTFAFAGWTPEITEVTGDMTYTAAFNATPITLTGLSVKKQPTKTVYTYRSDKDLDLAGLELEAAYSDGSVKPVDPAACKITGYSAKPAGDKTITAEYEGQAAQFKVTVKYRWWQWLIRIFLLGFIWY